MAKIVKKKSAAKPVVKNSGKSVGKNAKKSPFKAAAKPAPVKKAASKTIVKTKAEKAASHKVVKKPDVKKKFAAKPEVKVSKPVVPKTFKPISVEPIKELPVKKAPEKAIAAPVLIDDKAALKKDAKSVKKIKGKVKEKEKDETDLEDSFIADEEDMMGDEIGEYEEELKAVEEADEDIEVIEEWTSEEKNKADEEIVLTDAEGRRYCRARDCDQIAIVDIYCRFHYLMFWKKIQVRKKILVDGKLERYVEELTARYPDKFLEMIRRDLRTEKDFLSAIQELEIDESANEKDFEEDNSAFIEEVRGVGESTGSVDEDEY
jgi:hypothetical protein